jgi:hypothetical protein
MVRGWAESHYAATLIDAQSQYRPDLTAMCASTPRRVCRRAAGVPRGEAFRVGKVGRHLTLFQSFSDTTAVKSLKIQYPWPRQGS